MLTRQISTFEQFAFFALHGFFTVFESLVVYIYLKLIINQEKIVEKFTGFKIFEEAPNFLLFLYTITVQLWFMPLFFNQFIRAQSFFNMVIWIF